MTEAPPETPPPAWAGPSSARPAEASAESGAYAAARPRLSVLIPARDTDASDLLSRLDAQAADLGEACEILLRSDGGSDAGLADALAQRIRTLAAPALFLKGEGIGRAAGRNRLARAARGGSLLLLDADMSPVSDEFLRRWLELADAGVEIAFGGFVVRAPREPELRLHYALQAGSECRPAAERARDPGKHVYTCNLLVSRRILLSEPFDEAFRGWGWEDVEWGLRARERAEVVHLDNPAIHLGLDPAARLLEKYGQSGPNFARLLRLRPEARRFPAARAARLLKAARLSWAAARIGKSLAVTDAAPTPLRRVGLKLVRAAVGARALRAGDP